jgi:hypothetical protein
MKFELTNAHIVGACGTFFCTSIMTLNLTFWSELATVIAGFATAGYTLTHWYLLYQKHRRELLHPLAHDPENSPVRKV